jgi:hypothetical protein
VYNCVCYRQAINIPTVDVLPTTSPKGAPAESYDDHKFSMAQALSCQVQLKDEACTNMKYKTLSFCLRARAAHSSSPSTPKYFLDMKLSYLISLTVLTSPAISQNVTNVLIYGSAGSEEDKAATEFGCNTTIVTDSEWANMSTLDFARYDAVVVPDLNSDYISSLDFLEKSKDIWSPAITGNIIVIGESTNYPNNSYVFLQAQVATQ